MYTIFPSEGLSVIVKLAPGIYQIHFKLDIIGFQLIRAGSFQCLIIKYFPIFYKLVKP